jgi:lipoprotein NlpD
MACRGNYNNLGTYCKLSLLVLFLGLLLAGCIYKESYAPVIDAWQDPSSMKSRYRVQKDDTIYSIALAFDMDYRDIAKANHLFEPYPLKVGQTLSLQTIISPTSEANDNDPNGSVMTFAAQEMQPGVKSFEEVKQVVSLEQPPELRLPEFELKAIEHRLNKQVATKSKNILLPEKTLDLNQAKIIAKVNSPHWQWPAKGTIIKKFSLQSGGSKGIDIAGSLGDLVRATAPGRVVYSGSGLRGYGNLIIVKHSDNYLSAYAHNQQLLVKEGDVVKAGAEIAKMGHNDAGQVMLHFEIRRNGKPVNPLLYL